MFLSGFKSDVRQRAAQFEAIQADAIAALADPEVTQALGERAGELVTLIESAEPVGISRLNELVVPKQVDANKPLCFPTKPGETGNFVLPVTTFKVDDPYIDGYTTKSEHQVQIGPGTTNGGYYSTMTTTIRDGALRVTGTLPWLIRISPVGGPSFTASTFGHEIEHWRFLAAQDFRMLGAVSLGIVETASEREAYKVSAALEPQAANIPKTSTIVRTLLRKSITEPVEAAAYARHMVDSRLHTTNVSLISRHQEALALSQVFGNDSFVPTHREHLAYQAAGFIESEEVQ